MIFSRDSIEAIVNDLKNETRRIVKPSEYLDDGSHIQTVFTSHASGRRLKWQTGRYYGVQPGRGKPGVWWHPKARVVKLPTDTLPGPSGCNCRIDSNGGIDLGYVSLRFKLLKIRRGPLGAISEADAIAEGYPAKWPPPTMAAIQDGFISTFKFPQDDPVTWYRKLWESINGPKSWERDSEKDVWALTFEVVR